MTWKDIHAISKFKTQITLPYFNTIQYFFKIHVCIYTCSLKC